MTSKGFAGRVHVLLIASMIVSFALILQQAYFPLYRAGISLLIITILLQIPFGNISGEKNLPETLIAFLRFFSILVLVVLIAIFLAPYFVHLGGGA
jgi:hypothetical protein